MSQGFLIIAQVLLNFGFCQKVLSFRPFESAWRVCTPTQPWVNLDKKLPRKVNIGKLGETCEGGKSVCARLLVLSWPLFHVPQNQVIPEVLFYFGPYKSTKTRPPPALFETLFRAVVSSHFLKVFWTWIKIQGSGSRWQPIPLFKAIDFGGNDSANWFQDLLSKAGKAHHDLQPGLSFEVSRFTTPCWTPNCSDKASHLGFRWPWWNFMVSKPRCRWRKSKVKIWGERWKVLGGWKPHHELWSRKDNYSS